MIIKKLHKYLFENYIKKKLTFENNHKSTQKQKTFSNNIT